MAFDFMFRPPWPNGSVFREGSPDRINRFDPRTACFATNNTALFVQTVQVTVGVRLMTPRLVPPFNVVMIQTDSEARGRVDAAALPGYARARVETSVRVLDLSMRVLAEPTPTFYLGIDIPSFWARGGPFNNRLFADATLRSAVGGAPVIVEVRVSSWAAAYGWASATADIFNACITQVRVFSR